MSLSVSAQDTITIQGFIYDTNNKKRIADATVEINHGKHKTQSDNNGQFVIEFINNGDLIITVHHPQYHNFSKKHIEVANNLYIYLQPKIIELQPMEVVAQSKHTLPQSAINSVSVNRSFFQKNNASNLSSSLAKLPGIASMNIGAGVSKPVIRGMGFNRMAVVDKGIVVQNQQWGADHGLELDQFDVDQLIVHKGAMSLFYGSDAIGGVVEILPAETPNYDLTWGDVIITTRSNNELVGASVGLNSKSGNWFYRMRTTALNYGDYRIPIDTIEYMTWKIPMQNRRMKNTAGRELNLSGTVKYEKDNFNTAIFISNNYSKNGFFSGAHGVPDLKRLTFDGSYRNIELPHSTVNHFKISNTTEFPIFTDWSVHSDFGFQNNQRSEMAQFHTHYPNQTVPEKDSDVELAFNLKTFSGNVRFHNTDNTRWKKSIGISAEYQTNKIGGYSFLIPEFTRLTGGLMCACDYMLNDKWSLIGGLRLDLGKVETHGFYDNILEDYFKIAGYDTATAAFYAQRAHALQLDFTNISGSAGIIYKHSLTHLFKANLGRSFRFPTPNELASNGVHHGAFRYERGNPELKPESGLQWNMEYTYDKKKWRITVSPFVNYFSNYIFLNPTGKWSLLPHTGQQYEYTQAKALITGFESEAYFQAFDFLQFSSNIEYAFTLNLNSGYPLPFSPPTRWTSNTIYSADVGKLLTHYSINAEIEKVFEQNNIANNEYKTSGTWLFNLSISLNWKIQKHHIICELQALNIFNTAYLNHLSYYRKLNAPEQGRNLQVLLKFPF